MLIKNVLLDNRTTDILIHENKIVQIQDQISAHDEEVLDATNRAIFPSFANTHTHASMMFLRGVGEDKDLHSWLNEDIWPREAKLTAEHMYHLSRFAILEMIKTGTTLFTDMYFEVPQTVKAVDEMGIRAVIPFLGMDLFDKDELHKRLEIGRNFLNTPAPNDRIIKALAGHAIYTTSPELIQKFHQMTLDHHTFFQIHISETEKEVNDCLKQYGCRPVELLHQWGILGPHTLLAHAIHLDEHEIQLLVETKTWISHCPTSNFKLGSGQMNLQKYLDAGVRVTLGTDSVSSNNSLSMLSEMKMAALSAKNKSQNVQCGKVDDIFQIGTSNGFEAFQIPAGKIQVGALADFILVDINHHFLLPNYNLKSNLIYAPDSGYITDVFCNGKHIMENKQVPHEQEIIQNFKKVCHELGTL